MPSTNKRATSKPAARGPLAAVTLAAAAVAVLAGCTSPLSHGAAARPAAPGGAATSTARPSASASASAGTSAAAEAAAGKAEVTDSGQLVCAAQATWNAQAKVSLHALYADTGALAADAHAGNMPGVRKAGATLAADAVAAATLPLPAVDADEWQALTKAYATAGTALAQGGAITAVPQLEAGGSALGAFATAVAKCAAPRS